MYPFFPDQDTPIVTLLRLDPPSTNLKTLYNIFFKLSQRFVKKKKRKKDLRPSQYSCEMKEWHAFSKTKTWSRRVVFQTLLNKCPAKPGSEAGTKNSRAQSQSLSGPKGNTYQEQWVCFPDWGEGLN